MPTIGEQIKLARKEKKMTQKDLADALNVSRSAVSNWEIDRNYPDIQMIVDISTLMDVPLDSLLKGDQIVVEKITNDTKIRKTQSNKIKVLYAILAVLLLAFIGLVFFKFNYAAIHNENQIDSFMIKQNDDADKLIIETDIPKYRSITGYLLSSARNPWELDLCISTKIDLSMENQKQVSIDLSRLERENIMGINIINSNNDVFMTIPLNQASSTKP